MDGIIESAAADSRHCWVDIDDVGGGEAKLYLSNGGTWRTNPLFKAGDFHYQLQGLTFQVYHSDGWRTVNIRDVISLLPHPECKTSVLSFTSLRLPFWIPLEDADEGCRFLSLEGAMEKFRAKFDSEDLRISERPKRMRGEAETEGAQGDERVDQCPRSSATERPHLTAALDGGQTFGNPKNPSRFVLSSIGFPTDSQRVTWKAGFQTYLPFSGRRMQIDWEIVIVKDLSSRPPVEGSKSTLTGSCLNSFQVSELVVEVELDEALQAPQSHELGLVAKRWKEFIEFMKDKMRQSISVVVREGSSPLTLRFSKESMGLQFGDLGFRSQWIDSCLLANNRDQKESERQPYHENTTLSKFVDLVDDPNKCGNFLDGKELTPNPPMWAKPLLESTTAWEHTMHLRFLKGCKQKDGWKFDESGVKVIGSGTWTSQAWRLVSHPGFLTMPHHDCCGMGTYVMGNAGAKMWVIMRPKRDKCPSLLSSLWECLDLASEPTEEGFTNADVTTVCLEEGDVMFQPPGVLHTVYTPVPSIFTGGYFFNYETMHLSRAVLFMRNSDNPEGTLTNDHRAGFKRTLCRIIIELQFRSQPRRFSIRQGTENALTHKITEKIGKRSLLSLCLMILDCKNPEGVTGKAQNPHADEERGDLAFAKECTHSLLRWIGITKKDARNFVDQQGAYYLPGEEFVVLPALEEGEEETIFPQL